MSDEPESIPLRDFNRRIYGYLAYTTQRVDKLEQILVEARGMRYSKREADLLRALDKNNNLLRDAMKVLEHTLDQLNMIHRD